MASILVEIGLNDEKGMLKVQIIGVSKLKEIVDGQKKMVFTALPHIKGPEADGDCRSVRYFIPFG